MTKGHIREEDLELYALGTLPEEEAAAVRAHIAGCSECAPKLAKARGWVATLAFAVPQEKPEPAVKDKLFARIAAQRGIEGIGEPAQIERRQSKEERKPVIPWRTWVTVTTSMALAAVCLLLSWQNRQLASQVRVARQAAAGIQKEKENAEELVRLLASPDTVTVKLAGTSEAALALGYVKYNEKMGVVLYTVKELPSLPAEKVYQMWLVPTSGAPISAGVFKPEDSASRFLTAQVVPHTIPKAFAVTIEPTGGVQQPTGPKVLLGAS